jgi:hypothetical protein
MRPFVTDQRAAEGKRAARGTGLTRMGTPPVKINSTGLVETKMGERGPKLAVGSDGGVHVVWVDEWAPGVQTFVRYSRSLDGGRSFEALKTLSAMSGVDGVTVTADGKGRNPRRCGEDNVAGPITAGREAAVEGWSSLH